MDKPTFKTIEEAKEAQSKKAEEVKSAKSKLTTYYKENGLKRNEDYSKDKEHGGKIEKLQSRIDKRSNELDAINDAVKKFEPKTVKGKEKASKKEKSSKGGGNLKYEYPPDITTPDARKKYRIEQRKLAAGGEAKPKTSKKEKEVKEVEDKKSKKKSPVKKEKSTKETKTSAKKKVVSKSKSKPAEDDGDDD